MKIKNSFGHLQLFSCKVFVIFFVLANFFFAGVYSQEVEVTTITITNARQTTYTKDDKNGNDTIVLEGSVELSVSKGSTSSEIKADKITYDRQTEMLYAEGNVEILTKTSSSGGETTTASALLMNTATLEGAFDDGRIVQTKTDALNLPSGSTLIVFADVFGKSEDNTIAFKDSSLTFCDNEDPHWHINATRTWLLPGGEFAFLNAFLFVGYVPVLYLPAFYYPKDELIFNPVFSYTKREGYSIQNTIYLYGRKPLSDSSSKASSSETESSASAESIKALYNFMKPSTLKEQKREGLILHNLDEDYSGDTSKYIKIMADHYSTLGDMVGIDGNLSPAPNYISKLSFNAYAGFSNTIFEDSNTYYNFNPTIGLSYKDNSTFLGFQTPFRYAADLEFAIVKPFKLSISLPIYSDPFFAYDFKDNRQETMDWISFLMDRASTTENSTAVTVSEVSSFTWNINGSYSPVMPQVLKNYISSLSFSFNSSVLISSKSADPEALIDLYKRDYADVDKDASGAEEWANSTPYQKFYYPSQITPITANLNISGTLFQYPFVKNTTKHATANYPVALNKPAELKSAADIRLEEEQAKKLAEEKEAAKKAAEEEAKKKENGNLDDVPATAITDTLRTELISEIAMEAESEIIDKSTFVQPVLPDLTFTPVLQPVADGFSYKLNYSIAPSVTTQISYAYANLKQSEDFNWENIRSFMYTVKMPTSISNNLSYGGSFFNLSNKFSYDPVYQKHPIISEESEEDGGYSVTERKNLIAADYGAESQNVSTINSVNLKPFINTQHFADTGVAWNSTIRLWRKKFIGTADDPEWEEYGLDFNNEDCVTVNSIDLTLGSSQLNNKIKESLVLTSIMPPLLRQYNAKLNLTFPYVTASFGTGYVEQTHDEDVELSQKWKLSPLQQNLSVSLLNNTLKLSESFSYIYVIEDEENTHPESLKLNLSWKSLSLAFVSSYALGYDFDAEEGWVVRDEKEFLPYSLSFSFAPSTKTFYRWSNRISFAPGLNTSIVADLIRPTNSYFIFTPSLNFKINEFLNISFSSTSRNQVLYRYIQKFIGQDGMIPGEQNIFIDLLNSYRFDDENLRKASGFKLKSLNATVTHELHDWSFNMTFKIEPKLITPAASKNKNPYYDATPYITVGIVWNPMDSIKTNLIYQYDEEEEKGLWSLE